MLVMELTRWSLDNAYQPVEKSRAFFSISFLLQAYFLFSAFILSYRRSPA